MTDRILWGGADVMAPLGFLLTGFTDQGPEPVMTLVDIPGRVDGPLDLTESLTGFVPYGQRTLTATYAGEFDGMSERSAAVSAVMAALHGRRMRIRPDWQDGDFEGRCTVSVEPVSGYGAVVTVTAACDPYRTIGERTYEIDGWGGAWHAVSGGAAPQHPKVTCRRWCHIESEDGEQADIGPGTWVLPRIAVSGDSMLYVRTRSASTKTWDDLAGSTWGDLGSGSWDWLHVDGSESPHDPDDVVTINLEVKEL